MSSPEKTLHGPAGLARALAIAGSAHSQQLDSIGAPYMGHINRVMAYAESFRVLLDPTLDRYTVASAAALHDVVEDANVTLENLAEAGLDLVVVAAVERLTHRRHAPRAQYLSHLAADPVARMVKLGDTWDNADPVRLSQISDPARRERLQRKYQDAFVLLHGVSLPGAASRFAQR